MNWPDWTGEVAVLVATGPSAREVPLHLGQGRARFLAIKDAWRLCPWADLLYGCDDSWWQAHKGVRGFKGVCAAYDPATIRAFGHLHPFYKVTINSAHAKLLFGETGTVGWGGNSGFHALNLAIQFGARTILLVGFDYSVAQGLHFFGEHAHGRQRPNARAVKEWQRVLDGEARTLRERGVTVVNCSSISALQAFPKLSFKEALHAHVPVPPRLRLEAGSGCHRRLQGGNEKTDHDGCCGRCGEAWPWRDHQAGPASSTAGERRAASTVASEGER